MSIDFDVVVPTIGRPSLSRLLSAIDRAAGQRPRSVIVVDDRPPTADDPLVLPPVRSLHVRVERTGGAGPAAARNAGWRRATSEWVAFVDDDVEPSPSWLDDLVDDLARCDSDTAASCGTVTVPPPAHRRPTDGERGVLALADAAWITADMAVRREALDRIAGFDERFPRAYREDTDLALRLHDAGLGIDVGGRVVVHPVRTGTWSSSVRAQRGNADDALMRRLHGSDWRERGRAPAGALGRHLVTTGLTAGAVAAAALGRRRAAALAAAIASITIARCWWDRVRRGPASPREWGRMAASSALIPFAATWHAGWGRIRARRLAPRGRGDRWGIR